MSIIVSQIDLYVNGTLSHDYNLIFVLKWYLNILGSMLIHWRQTGDKSLSKPMMTSPTDTYMRLSSSIS